MKTKGIEVHEFQKPRKSKPRRRRDDLGSPISRTDRLWILVCIAGSAAVWAVIIWAFA